MEEFSGFYWLNVKICQSCSREKYRQMDNQGTNARKVISYVYAFFVLQCAVFGRKSKHKTDSTAWHGIHFHKNNLWNILVIENYHVRIIKIIKIKCFNTPRILNEHWCIYSCLKIPEATGFNMYAKYTQPQLTFLALVPCR